MDQVNNTTETELIDDTFVQLGGSFSATSNIERFAVNSNQLEALVAGEGIATFMCDSEKIGGGADNDLEWALFKNGVQQGDIIRFLESITIAFAVSFQNDVDFVAGDVFDVRVNRVTSNDDILVRNATLFIR